MSDDISQKHAQYMLKVYSTMAVVEISKGKDLTEDAIDEALITTANATILKNELVSLLGLTGLNVSVGGLSSEDSIEEYFV
ncbi:MAG: hypothetical protein ACEPOV_10005 [Hyphomicrobiales bacterium]